MKSSAAIFAAAILAAMVASVLAFAPPTWLGELLNIGGGDVATEFLTKRYGASATAGLFAVAIGASMRWPADRSVFLGFSTWFAVQGAVAIWGLMAGMVGGLAWLAAFSDPVLAAGFLYLTSGSGRFSSGHDLASPPTARRNG